MSFMWPPIYQCWREKYPPMIGGVNKRKWRQCVGFTLPLFVNATGRKYLPQLRGKQKGMKVACRFHTAPVGNEKK